MSTLRNFVGLGREAMNLGAETRRCGVQRRALASPDGVRAWHSVRSSALSMIVDVEVDGFFVSLLFALFWPWLEGFERLRVRLCLRMNVSICISEVDTYSRFQIEIWLLEV